MIHHFKEGAGACHPACESHRLSGVGAFAPASAVILTILAGLAPDVRGGEAAVRRVEPTCLAISPLRAIPALTGRKDSLGPEGWRDAVVRALRQARTDSNWIFRPAGECPESVATIDVFQLPTDVVASPQGQVLRMRMEWKHVVGQSEFFLSASETHPLEPLSIANQLLAIADQRMAQIELSSLPPGAIAKILSGAQWHTLGPSPQSILVPPGALSVAFDSPGMQRRIDTLVGSGRNYLVVADFRAERIDPRVSWEPRRTWPWWSLALISVAGGLWATREQVLAQRAYSRLGSGDSPETYSEKWSQLRTANLWRNGLFSAALVVGTGASWMEWSNRHNP